MTWNTTTSSSSKVLSRAPLGAGDGHSIPMFLSLLERSLHEAVEQKPQPWGRNDGRMRC